MSMVECERRTRRQDPGHARVTAREWVALDLVAQAGTIRTDQFGRLIEAHPRIGRRSAQKLRNLGLVDAKLTALHDANRLVLTRDGARELARVTGGEPEEFKPLSGIGNLDLDHHDQGVDLAIAMRLACAKSRTWTLERLLFERQVRAATQAGPGVLVPDLVFVLADGAGERFAIAGEVDQGTENVSYFVTKKGAWTPRTFEGVRARLVQEPLLPPRPTKPSDRWTGLGRPEGPPQADPGGSSLPGLMPQVRS